MSYNTPTFLDNFRKLFHKKFADDILSIEPLIAGASKRQIYRISTENKKYIVIFNENVSENKAFIKFTQIFKANGFNVPEIYIVSNDSLYYLEEDLGDETLFSYCKSHKCENLYLEALRQLAYIQIELKNKIDYNYCYETKIFDNAQLEFDLNKFNNSFVKQFEIQFSGKNFENIKKYLLDSLDKADKSYFIYRDYQPRNIMLYKNEFYFIDYQSGRKGPLYYDVVSFIFSGSSNITNENKLKYLEQYNNILKTNFNLDYSDKIKEFYDIAVMRILQMLGSYGSTYSTKKDTSYLKKINKQVDNILFVVENSDVPEMKKLYELVSGFNETIIHT
ncbi:MAG TPA: phosphotransferase [Ignavibacteria bacterium]|nr:phosphotransferase [Ignavibacteria bacterium]